MAATQAGLGLTGNVIIAAVLLMLSSAAFALCDMTVVTMLQRDVPDALLGRVSSVFGTVTQGGAKRSARSRAESSPPLPESVPRCWPARYRLPW